MKLSEFSIKRPITITMMILIVMVFGGISFTKIPVNFLPDLEFPMCFVMTTYSGAAPEEIENLVTKWIEETVNTVDNVKKVTTFSQESLSLAMVEFNWGTNMDFAAQDVREKIDRINMFLPDDVDKSMVFKFDLADMPVIWMGLSSDEMDGRELRDYVDDVLQDKFERVKGVAAVYIYGGDQREILVNVDKNKLEAYGLSIEQITNKLRTANKNLPGGKIKTLHKEFLVRSIGEYEDVDEIGETPLTYLNGAIVRIKDVAEVLDTNKEKHDITHLNGSPSVGIAIMKQTGANTLEVSNGVHEVIDEIKSNLPGDTTVAVNFDQGLYVRQSSKYLRNSLAAGGALAMLIVFLFLRNVRSTLIICISIPVSLVATFVLIYFRGMSLNAMSLGGLALGVGMLVDNSIVVIESIYRHFALGEERNLAANRGASEVGMPIFASTMTTVAVFLPIAFTSGFAGRLFSDLAWSVSFSLFGSLFVALTIVPMLCAKILKLRPSEMDTEKRLRKTKGMYYRVIEYSLKHRFKIILFALLLLAIPVYLVASKRIGANFIEQSDSNEIIINFELPKGTALQETSRVMKRFEQKVLDMPDVKNFFVMMGFNEDEPGDGANMESEQGSNTGFVVITLNHESEGRTKPLRDVIDDIRELANIPGLKVKFQDTMQAIMGMGSPINLKIFGDDLDVLSELSASVSEAIKSVPGLVDLNASSFSGKPELQIKYKRDKLAEFGLSVGGVSQMVKTAIQGRVATEFREGGEEFGIRVRLQEQFRENVEDLRELTVTSPDGRQLRLNDIAEVNSVGGPSRINRENQKRYALITGDASQMDLKSIVDEIKKRLKDIKLPQGYTFEFGGEASEMEDSFEKLAFALLLGIIIVYMVMAAEFESLVDPLVIMFTLPLALIGAVLALYVTNHSINVVSIIGIIMLVGIVVNNAIVLVDYINLLRRRGMEKDEAIKQAGVTRLRPILITALTTMFGLLPIALGIGEGAETRAPMAVAVIGGLLSSTLLTLVVIPVTYSLLESAGASVKRVVKQAVQGNA